MTKLADVNGEALSADELDHVTGGIIIVGGHTLQNLGPASPFERVAVHQQPLPPVPPPFRSLFVRRH